MGEVGEGHGRARGVTALGIRERREARNERRWPDVAQRFQLDGAEPVGSTPQAFAAFLKVEMQKWSKVIKDAGIKPES